MTDNPKTQLDMVNSELEDLRNIELSYKRKLRVVQEAIGDLNDARQCLLKVLCEVPTN